MIYAVTLVMDPSLSLSLSLSRPEQVAEAILQLATDNSKTGAVMTVTLKRGIDFFVYPGDPGYSSKKAKL